MVTAVEYLYFENDPLQQTRAILRRTRRWFLFGVVCSFLFLMSTIIVGAPVPYGIFRTEMTCLLNLPGVDIFIFHDQKDLDKIPQCSPRIAAHKQGGFTAGHCTADHLNTFTYQHF